MAKTKAKLAQECDDIRWEITKVSGWLHSACRLDDSSQGKRGRTRLLKRATFELNRTYTSIILGKGSK